MTVIELPFDELLARLDRIEAKQDAILAQKPEPAEYLTVKDVAAKLRCKPDTVRRKARNGEIRVAKRNGNRMLFSAAEIGG